ncbi:amidohydrolase family protein, partial [Chloroflexota bacterium]
MKKIDVHQHIFPEGYIAALKKGGDRFPDKVRVDSLGKEEMFSSASGGWRPITGDPHFDLGIRIRDMDASGRDLSVLSPGPTALVRYDLDAKLGEEVARIINDAIAEIVSDHPEHFMGMAMIPLQHPSTALKEMERAAKQLGMRAIEIGTNVNGTNLDAPELFPVFEKARDLGLLVYVHPTNVVSRKERLRSYHLENCIG